MTFAKEPAGYTATQILLHWAIAALIVLQSASDEDIKPAYRAGSAPTARHHHRRRQPPRGRGIVAAFLREIGCAGRDAAAGGAARAVTT
jgi:hypothetical protein